MIEERIPTLKEKHLEKDPIGITSFDDITGGGLPKDRTTLVYGNVGSGKTLIAMDFLFKGTNSIFIGDKLLTTPNHGTSKDHLLMASLRLKASAPDNKYDGGCCCEKLRA